MAGVGAVERLVAQGKVGDDVAFDGGLEDGPLKPRGIAQMATLDVAVGSCSEPHQHVAAKTFDQRYSFARARRSQRGERFTYRPRRKLAQDLIDQRQALLDFADADPDAGIDIALFPHRNLEPQRIVGRVARYAPRIEAAPGGAADV